LEKGIALGLDKQQTYELIMNNMTKDTTILNTMEKLKNYNSLICELNHDLDNLARNIERKSTVMNYEKLSELRFLCKVYTYESRVMYLKSADMDLNNREKHELSQDKIDNLKNQVKVELVSDSGKKVSYYANKCSDLER
jgi:uncharacterized protein (DUF2249 family)